MTTLQTIRSIGPRVAWAAGPIVLTLGLILLRIVGDPPTTRLAFLIGVAAVSIGAVLILAGIESLLLPTASPLSWRDGARGLVIATLTLIIVGLVLEVGYNAPAAYEMVVANALPLLVALALAYVGSRALLTRLARK